MYALGIVCKQSLTCTTSSPGKRGAREVVWVMDDGAPPP